jgi:UPF0755 protein
MKKILVVLGLLILFSILTFVWWQNGLLPADNSNKSPKIFVIQNGQGVREISNNLKKSDLIRDPIVFFLLTKMQGIDKKIQAGDFRLNPAMSAQEIATTLTHGTLDIWTTIPEGLRADEIADISKAGIPSYESSWRDALVANEGYLFPDTYLIPRDADIDLVLSLLKNNFQKKFDSVRDTKTTNLTNAQTITVASMVEREAKYASDRPLVASVIINRLNIGMALQIDATIQYALGYQADTKTWWKKDLTLADLKINSPYNTYKNVGLPPTPISNPGLSAIEAALKPADTNYLYYYSDKQGHLHFATTIEGHNANIKKYGE